MLRRAFRPARTFVSMARSLSEMARRDAEEFLRFVDASPSPFHAVAETARRLEEAGFRRLSERSVWGTLENGGKYYVTRNQTAIIAFAVGKEFRSENGFTIVAAHTDSPCLKVKPRSGANKAGLLTIGTETYEGAAGPGGAGIRPSKAQLVDLRRPILRVPSLAIHLDRTVNEKFAVNKEDHLWAVLSSAADESLSGAGTDPTRAGTRHPPALLELLAEALGEGTRPEDIQDFELCLYDTQGAAIGGASDEFIHSARLDNLLMSYTGLQALLRSTQEAESLEGEPNTRVLALFDNEEVGSDSVPGAGSTFLEDVLRRIVGEETREAWPVALRRSILVSADMAHACHPNYAHFHERNHRPALNGGIVIKQNCNQRYATTAVTAAVIRSIAGRIGLPVQDFVIRQDLGCGSTIGPILATRLGIRTVDVGVAQLSMHSIRETCGSKDVAEAIDLFDSLYRLFPDVDAAIEGTE